MTTETSLADEASVAPRDIAEDASTGNPRASTSEEASDSGRNVPEPSTASGELVDDREAGLDEAEPTNEAADQAPDDSPAPPNSVSDPQPDVETLEETEPLVDAQQSDSEPEQTEPLDSEQSEAEQTDSEQTDSEQTDSEQTDTEQLDSEQLDSEQTDTEQIDAESADAEPAGAKRTSLVKATVGGLRKHVVMIVTCAFSLQLGIVLAMVPWHGEEPKVEPPPPKPTYVASIARRAEPIAPLAPIESLDPNIVKLGRRIFHDPGMSGNGKVSCASCHNLSLGGSDGLATSIGATGRAGSRNAPTVFNSVFNFSQFWDGRVQTLEEQVDGPLQHPDEMASDWERTTKYLRNDPTYSRMFKEYMGGQPSPERVRKALATYERSLVTVNSRFDRWLQGEEQILTVDEYAGYQLFKKLNCVSCHQGAGVGGTMLQRLGEMKTYFDVTHDPSETDLGRYHVTKRERDRYVFRVPPLRNVEQTAPYFHDGSVATLEEAVAIMIEYQLGLEVRQQDVDQLSAFLRSLTGRLADESDQEKESKPRLTRRLARQ